MCALSSKVKTNLWSIPRNLRTKVDKRLKILRRPWTSRITLGKLPVRRRLIAVDLLDNALPIQEPLRPDRRRINEEVEELMELIED